MASHRCYPDDLMRRFPHQKETLLDWVTVTDDSLL
jgi:hypothetical protein